MVRLPNRDNDFAWLHCKALRTHVILTEEPVLNIVKEGISLCYTGFSWLFIAGSVRWFDRLTMTLVFIAFRCRIGEMVRQAHHDTGFRCFSSPDRRDGSTSSP
jgi:hypothetical protein